MAAGKHRMDNAADFTSFTTKSAAYAHVHESLASLVVDQRNWVAATANAASLLWHLYHSLPAPTSSVNWAGFYTLNKTPPTKTSAGSDGSDAKELILGPFQGKVACQTIKFGTGVCGTAAQDKKTVLVKDVEEFPGHIACDGDSKSEIVVPVLVDGRVVAVIDIDCAEVGGFDEDDKEGLERLAELLAKSCDW
ncbi:Free methionine-R-sulfoxide [Cyphellophora attinorum]|uniref:Free methionine-R-sulfoxide n=1 Tax=Cyphellophora attinorum TaxID=1664694 RepID=A0A0N0NQ81_9EURO|nr:Free methionine-R-sulfoxide [Phialophora attinorum]KPI43601.1 Free methionine-R-sulfoxide [Phialophora attinorum]